MSPPSKHESFVKHLEGLTENRGALAALRRGLGKRPGEAAEMHRYIVPFLGGEEPRHEEAYYLVAALFAWHQGSWHHEEGRVTNLGASFARLAASKESDSIEKRFVALLNCHREDLDERLRHAVGLLKSKDIPIDWAQLLGDIQGWGWESRAVQRSWARGFWGSRPGEQPETATIQDDSEEDAEESEED